MAVTPTTPAAKAPGDLRTLISNSTWFQTWTGAADAAAAAAHVIIGELQHDAVEPTAPYLVVVPTGIKLDVPGSGGQNVPSGLLSIIVTDDVTTTYKDDGENAILEALEAVSRLAEEIAAGIAAGYRGFAPVTVVEGPLFRDRGQDGTVDKYKRWDAVIEAVWGVGG